MRLILVLCAVSFLAVTEGRRKGEGPVPTIPPGPYPDCEPGKRYVPARQECVVCATRSYTDGKSGTCTYCPTGYTTRGQGKSSIDDCNKCDHGYKRDGDSCVACPPGEYGNYRTEKCEQCPAGSTTTEAGSSYCRCLSGHYRVALTGECKPCPKGTYRGFFTSQCLPYPEGTTTESESQA